MNFCPHCGTKTRTPEDKFCANCGAILTPLSGAGEGTPSEAIFPEAAIPPISSQPDLLAEADFVAEYIAPPKKTTEEPEVNPDALATDLLASISRSSSQGKYKVPKAEPAEKDIFSAEKEDDGLDRTQVFSIPSQFPQEEQKRGADFAVEPLPPQGGNGIEHNESAPAEFVFASAKAPSAPAKLFEESPRGTGLGDSTLFVQEAEPALTQPEQSLVQEDAAQAHKDAAEKAAKLAQVLSVSTAEEFAPTPPSLHSLLEAKEEQTKTGPPPLPPLPSARSKKEGEYPSEKKSTGKKIATVLVGIVLFVLATAGVTLGMLYWNNRPDKTINQFITALQARNYAALNETVLATGFAPTNEGWDALATALASQEQVDALAKELKGNSVEAPVYSSIHLTKEPLFLFINQYTIQLSGVEVLLAGAGEGYELGLGSTMLQGRPVNEGMLYSNIMPGVYTAFTANSIGERSENFTLTALDALRPNQQEIGAGYTLTLGNCMSDFAVLYVDGVEVPNVPVNGVATLQNVALGSVITIVVPGEGGSLTSSVTFSDATATALSFQEYLPQEPAAPASSSQEPAPNTQLTQGEIDGILATYYASYLGAINEQSIASLQLSTLTNNKEVETRIQKPANKQNTFTFTSAQCDPASIVTGEENGTPSITFNATFGFSYRPRDNSAEATNSTNKQTVQLLLVDGQWQVNRMAFVSDTDFAAHKLAGSKA